MLWYSAGQLNLYSSGLHHWHWGKHPEYISVHASYACASTYNITTTKQSTENLCGYFVVYTVYILMKESLTWFSDSRDIFQRIWYLIHPPTPRLSSSLVVPRLGYYLYRETDIRVVLFTEHVVRQNFLLKHSHIKRQKRQIDRTAGSPGARPTNGILMVFHWSQRNFAHVTTVKLSWLVQNFVVIGRVNFQPKHGKF